MEEAGCELSSHAAPTNSDTCLFPFQQDIAYYIESEMDNLVLECSTGNNGMPVVMNNVKSNPPIARQQWYIVNQTGGRCHIHSKVDRKALTCKDDTVTVCDLHSNDVTQLWSWDEDNIISAQNNRMVGVAKTNTPLSLYEWDRVQCKEPWTKFHKREVTEHVGC